MLTAAPSELGRLLKLHSEVNPEEDPGQACRLATEAYRVLLRIYAAAAFCICAGQGLPPKVTVELGKPVWANRWERLLEGALKVIDAGHPMAAPLRTASEGLGNVPLLKGYPSRAEQHKAHAELAKSLAKAVAQAEPFFRAFPARTVTLADGQLRLYLGDLDLHPFLDVRDCQDCDALGQTFVYAGTLGAHGIYKSLAERHLSLSPAPWPASDGGALPELAAQPDFPDDPLKQRPEALLAPLRRHLKDQPGGYMLIEGGDGAGKSYLLRFLQQEAGGAAALYLNLELVPTQNPPLWLAAADGALREELGATPEGVRLPSPEVALDIGRRETRADLRLVAWLRAVEKLNARNVLLLIDGVEEIGPLLPALFPEELPVGLYVAMAYNPERAHAANTEWLTQRAHAGALLVKLDTFAGTAEQVARAAGLPAQGTVQQVRLLQAARLAGLLEDAAEPPDATGAALLEAARQRLGARAFKQVLEQLLLLAAWNRPLPIQALVEWLGYWEVTALAPWLRRRGDSLELAHPALARHLRARYSEALKAVCKRFCWWASRLLEAGCANPPLLTRLALEWALASQDARLLALTLRTTPARLAAQQLDGPPTRSRIHLLESWGRGLEADPSVPLKNAGPELWHRGRLLGECGDRPQARGFATQLIDALSSAREEPVLLARSLALRAELANDPGSYQAQHDADEAVATLSELKQDPHSEARSRRLLALAHEEMSEDDLACEQLEKAALLLGELPEEQARVLAELARVRWRQADYSRALETATRAASLLPRGQQLCEVLELRSIVRSVKEAHTLALEDARGVAEIYGSLVQEGRLDLEPALAAARHELGRLLTEAMQNERATLELEGAVRLFEELVSADRVELRPELARALCDLAWLRDPASALVLYSRASELLLDLVDRQKRAGMRGELARALNNRAQILLSQEKLEPAERDFTLALKHLERLNEDDADSYRGALARLLTNQVSLWRLKGELAHAVADSTRAIDLLSVETPGLDLANAVAARGLARLRMGDGEAALEDHHWALTLYERLVGSHTPYEMGIACANRGTLLAEQSRARQAQEDYQKALEVLGERSETAELRTLALWNRGRALADLGEHAPALADFTTVLQRNSAAATPAVTWGTMAWCCAHLGRLTEAVGHYGKALALVEGGPTRGRLLQGRARAHHLAGSHQSALDDLAAADELLPLALDWQVEARLDRCRVLWDLADYEKLNETAVQLVTEPIALYQAEAHLLAGLAQEARLEPEGARPHYDLAIALYSELAEQGGPIELLPTLAFTHVRRAALGPDEQSAADFGWAIDLYDELVQSHGKPELTHLLGLAWAGRGAAHEKLGDKAAAENDYVTAAAWLERVVSLGPPVVADLARTYLALGRLRGAMGGRAWYQKAVSVTAQMNDLRVLALRESAELASTPGEAEDDLKALAGVEKLPVGEPPEPFPVPVPRGVNPLPLPEPVPLRLPAGLGARQAGMKAPSMPEIIMGRTDLLVRAGRPEAALKELQRALDLDSLPPALRMAGLSRKASLQSRTGRYADAIETYGKALELASQDDQKADLHLHLGLTLGLAGEAELAIGELGRSIEARTRVLSKQKRPQDLRDLARAHNNRGSCQADQGRPKEALADFDRAIESIRQIPQLGAEPELLYDLALAHNNRGQTLADLERVPEAVFELTEAIDLYSGLLEYPGDGKARGLLATAYFNRGCVYLGAGQNGNALGDLRRCIGYFRGLVTAEGKNEYRGSLAEAYLARAQLLDAQPGGEALDDYERAAGILAILVETEGRDDLLPLLEECREGLKAALATDS